MSEVKIKYIILIIVAIIVILIANDTDLLSGIIGAILFSNGVTCFFFGKTLLKTIEDI